MRAYTEEGNVQSRENSEGCCDDEEVKENVGDDNGTTSILSSQEAKALESLKDQREATATDGNCSVMTKDMGPEKLAETRKKIICRFWKKYGDCKFDSECRYNHPELKTENKKDKKTKLGKGNTSDPATIEREKSTICSYWARYGNCKFKERCWNSHPPLTKKKDETEKIWSPKKQEKQIECMFWSRNGKCKFGEQCWNYHTPKNEKSNFGVSNNGNNNSRKIFDERTTRRDGLKDMREEQKNPGEGIQKVNYENLFALYSLKNQMKNQADEIRALKKTVGNRRRTRN